MYRTHTYFHCVSFLSTYLISASDANLFEGKWPLKLFALILDTASLVLPTVSQFNWTSQICCGVCHLQLIFHQSSFSPKLWQQTTTINIWSKKIFRPTTNDGVGLLLAANNVLMPQKATKMSRSWAQNYIITADCLIRFVSSSEHMTSR